MDGLSEKEKENDANYAKNAKSGALAGEKKSVKVEPSTASILSMLVLLSRFISQAQKSLLTAHSHPALYLYLKEREAAIRECQGTT